MMRLVTDDTDREPIAFPATADAAVTAESWPGEAEMILSAMDAAARPTADRRANGRRHRRGQADLRLYAHSPDAAPFALFTRDVSASGVGFITQQCLPLGYTGLVRLTLEDGKVVTAACSVYRCRPAIGGWFEGALNFASRMPELG